jgi:hypothetical protein
MEWLSGSRRFDHCMRELRTIPRKQDVRVAKPTRTRRNEHEKLGKPQHRYGHDVGTHPHYPVHLGPPPDPSTA